MMNELMSVDVWAARTAMGEEAEKVWLAKFAGSFFTYEGEAVYVKKVIVNEKKQTVVILWSDSTTTVAKCNPGDPITGECGDKFNPEVGMLVATMKKIMTPKRFREYLAEYLPGEGENERTLSQIRKLHK